MECKKEGSDPRKKIVRTGLRMSLVKKYQIVSFRLGHNSNIRYWRNKIKNNKERDREVNRILKKEGWKIVRIWESGIKRQII